MRTTRTFRDRSVEDILSAKLPLTSACQSISTVSARKGDIYIHTFVMNYQEWWAEARSTRRQVQNLYIRNTFLTGANHGMSYRLFLPFSIQGHGNLFRNYHLCGTNSAANNMKLFPLRGFPGDKSLFPSFSTSLRCDGSLWMLDRHLTLGSNNY